MAFIWNDKTFWDRYKKGFKVFKLFIPIFIVCVISIYFSYALEVKKLFLFSFVCALTIVTFIDIFIETPNPGIPDTYSSWSKKLMYVSYFFLSLIVTYLVGSQIL